MGTNLAKKPDIANSTKTAVDEQRPFMLDYPFAYPAQPSQPTEYPCPILQEVFMVKRPFGQT
jgi:hypothetical protein